MAKNQTARTKMSATDFQFPTLGQFNKVLCDCLGLWSSDGKSLEFYVPASERARREALKSAFDAIKRENGTYGSLDKLVSVTTKIAPESKLEIKKARLFSLMCSIWPGRTTPHMRSS